MEIRAIEPRSAPPARELLSRLRVSAFGVHSPRLHRILISDALHGRVDARVAIQDDRVTGIVLAAPPSYWTSTPLRHWGLALECARARLTRSTRHSGDPASESDPSGALARVEDTSPPVTWSNTQGAWRIIFIGTAPEARGRGIGAELYRAMTADRPLVARIARGNTASMRLHASVGWRLFRDGDVVLAVHTGPAHSAPTAAGGR